MSIVSIAQRISKPSQRVSAIAGCIYGRGGVGKTTLLGTMPGKGLVVDVPIIEGGSFVLSDHSDRIDVITITRWDELEELVVYLREGKHEYKWLGLDTVTAMQRLAMRKTIRERPLDADPYIMSQQDYGKIGNLMGELFLRVRALPLYTIFVAQERSRVGENLITEKSPELQPSALTALIPPMTFVGRLYVVEMEMEDGIIRLERRLRIGPSEDTVTKVRTSSPTRQVPAVIREPNLAHLIAYLVGATDKPLDGAEPDDISIV